MAQERTWDNIKKSLRQFWDFIWNEDSIWSWMANILIAFIIIKFIIYPVIGLALGTNLPVVAVISESMEHDGSFDAWWNSPATCSQGDALVSCTQAEWYEAKGITKEQFHEFKMSNGFDKGDIILLKGASFEELQVGDVLVYQTKLSYPVIHRIVYKDDLIETKGDHNLGQINDPRINEKYIDKDQIIGKAWIRIPYLGYIKIWFAQMVQCITFNGCTIGR